MSKITFAIKVGAKLCSWFPLQLFGFLALWLLALEVLLRVFLISPRTIVADPILGWRYPVERNFRMAVPDVGYTSVTTNAFGLLDKEIDAKKERKRVLVVGDSFVEALQVPRGSNFVSLVEHANPRFQLVNGGRSALDPLSERFFALRLAPMVHPDAVIWVIDAYNEEEIPYENLTLKRCRPSGAVCDYTINADGRGPFRKIVNSFEARSALVTDLAQKYQFGSIASLLNCCESTKRSAIGSEKSAISSTDLESLLVVSFMAITKECPVLVVYVPVLNYAADRRVQEPLAGLRWRHTVEAAALKARATFVDVGPALAYAYRLSGQPPVGFDFDKIGEGHLNLEGHIAVANVIGSRLKMFGGPGSGR